MGQGSDRDPTLDAARYRVDRDSDALPRGVAGRVEGDVGASEAPTEAEVAAWRERRGRS